MSKRWWSLLLSVGVAHCVAAPAPRGGAMTVDEPPPSDDAGAPVAAPMCRAMGSFTLSAGRSFVGSDEGRPWNGLVIGLNSPLLGTGSNYIWAFDLQVDPRRQGQTIGLEDTRANRSFSTASEVILVGAGCSGAFTTCDRLYMAERGYARFDASAARAGDAFNGSFSALSLRRVRIDGDTLATEFVEGEECLGMELFAFSTTAALSAGTGCESHATCDTCTPIAGCGWCANAGRCVSGTATGAGDGLCAGTDWDWLPRECTAPSVPDAGAPRPDAGAPRPDAGAPRPDAGAPRPDAGAPADVPVTGSGGSGGPIAVDDDGAAIGGSTDGSGAIAAYAPCTPGTTTCNTATRTCISGTGRTYGVCAAQCTRDGDCASGGVCIPFGSGQAWCVRICPASGCAPQQACRNSRSVSGRTTPVCGPDYW